MKLFSQNCGGLAGFLSSAGQSFINHFGAFKDCDVILIQELRVCKTDSIRLNSVLETFRELGYPYHSTLWAEKGNGGCITFSKTRLTVLHSSKSVLVTHTKVEGTHYVIANCYIPNYGYGDGKSKLDFIKSSDDLFKGILEKCDLSSTIAVLAGDFNAVIDPKHCKRKGLPGSLPVEVEWINGFTSKSSPFLCGEVTASITGPNGEFYTYYSFRGRKANTPQGSLLGSMRLDHVFATKNASVVTMVENTITARDHFPLVSTMCLRDYKNE